MRRRRPRLDGLGWLGRRGWRLTLPSTVRVQVIRRDSAFVALTGPVPILRAAVSVRCWCGPRSDAGARAGAFRVIPVLVRPDTTPLHATCPSVPFRVAHAKAIIVEILSGGANLAIAVLATSVPGCAQRSSVCDQHKASSAQPKKEGGTELRTNVATPFVAVLRAVPSLVPSGTWSNSNTLGASAPIVCGVVSNYM